LASINQTNLLFSRHKGEFIIYTNKNNLVGKYSGLKLTGSEGGGGLWEVIRLEIYRVKDSIGFSIINSIS
jgi:hypothetical protein